MFAPTLKNLTLLTVSTVLAVLLTLGASRPAFAETAAQKAADHVSKDKWARSEPSSAHHSSSDDDDDDDDSDSHSSDHHSSHSTPHGHEGELNGHVSIHGW